MENIGELESGLMFTEKQYYRQTWLMIMLSLLFLVPTIVFSKQLLFRIPLGTKPGPDLALVLVLLFIYVLIYGFLTTNLNVELNEEGILLKWKPFEYTDKQIAWADITEIKIEKKNFFLTLGYHFWFKESIYNAAGKNVLHIKLKSGNTYTVSIKDKKAAESFLAKNKTKHNYNLILS